MTDCIIRIKNIPNYPHYYADVEGNIYSVHNNSITKLKNDINISGYAYVNLYEQGKRTHARVHRLVAQTYIQNEYNKPTVNHINGIKTDNRVANLEWNTISENTQHAVDSGLLTNDKGYDDSQSIPIIATRLEDNTQMRFGSCTIAANELGVSLSTVARQVKGKTKPSSKSKYKFERDMECND